MKAMQKVISRLIALSLAVSLAACDKQPTASVPTESASPANPSVTQMVTYDASQDAPFLPKDIFFDGLFTPGITLGQPEKYTLTVTDDPQAGAFVVPGEYGKCYEIKIPAGVPYAAAARFSEDPRSFPVGKQLNYSSETSVKTITQRPGKEVSFMYVCRTSGEFLVIYTGSSDPIYIGERTIIQDTDTEGPWYIPEPVGDIAKNKGLGSISWKSEEFFDNLYEPIRVKYPDYISRSTIGKDATGSYNMYCYVYAPENYEATLFLVSGMHGDEEVGYFALAKCMQLIADATPEDGALYTLRQKVRFVVIPVVNVWSVSNTHSRTNGKGADLNRDFEQLSQQESKNVINCFKEYAKEADVVMDFHIANASQVALYFNFINYSDNAVVNYKTTNHMYHRYRQLKYASKYTSLAKVPGSYTKGSQYFEGRIWNQYKVPTITVEYMTVSNFPKAYTNECMTLAVETYINFIIQNGLFYIQA